MIELAGWGEKTGQIIGALYEADRENLPKIGRLNAALDESHRCVSRDIFNAKLSVFFSQINDPLLTAVCGEIGNNAFDHNLGNWHEVAGLYFNYDQPGLVIFVDRGQGILNSLKRVRPHIQNDLEAVETAFTERVSGRDPEQRGNGLKFVAEAVKKNGWGLFFQSGNGVCWADKGRIAFENAGENSVNGCCAVVKYK
jgi:hypothetical protein